MLCPRIVAGLAALILTVPGVAQITSEASSHAKVTVNSPLALVPTYGKEIGNTITNGNAGQSWTTSGTADYTTGVFEVSSYATAHAAPPFGVGSVFKAYEFSFTATNTTASTVSIDFSVDIDQWRKVTLSNGAEIGQTRSEFGLMSFFDTLPQTVDQFRYNHVTYWGHLGSGALDTNTNQWTKSFLIPAGEKRHFYLWAGSFASAHSPAPVPEPATIAALSLGMLALRRRRARA